MQQQKQVLITVPVTRMRVDFYVLTAPNTGGVRGPHVPLNGDDLLDLVKGHTPVYSDDSEPSVDMDDVTMQPLHPGVTVNIQVPPTPLPSFSLPTNVIQAIQQAKLTYYEEAKRTVSIEPTSADVYIHALETYIKALEGK